MIQEAYARGLTIGDLPSKTDLVLPPLPSPASTHPTAASTAIEEEEDVDGARAGGKLREQWRERQQLQQRVKKRNAELFSLRCDVEIKLRIAEEFRGHEFFFPYNLDFRGRCVFPWLCAAHVLVCRPAVCVCVQGRSQQDDAHVPTYMHCTAPYFG